MKSVCIIGAGPGGLVAAKTLLQTGHYTVTVFEQNPRIGGIWALDKSTVGTFLSPFTTTNLSRFTVSFSDLDWNSVNLGEPDLQPSEDEIPSKQQPPMFPKAWMANRYLEEYRKRYVPDDALRLGHRVTKAHRSGSQWQVTTQDESSTEKKQDFEYLILASGFFARPRLLQQDVPSFAGAMPGMKVMHTSEFRHLNDLVPPDEYVRGKRILVLGGGNSSGETAASIAMQLSDAQWSSDAAYRQTYSGCKIVHVTPRPIYPLPPFNEQAEASRSYVPLDLKLYDLSRRPKGMPSYGGLAPKTVRDMIHGMMQTMVGGDQSDISEALVAPDEESRGAPYVAITEMYSEFVRAGMIDVVRGRVTSIEQDAMGSASAKVQCSDILSDLNDVFAVVYATGYIPSPAIEILDDDTKAALMYDPTSMRLPMILEQWQTMSRDVSSLSLIGFYEGPYWPMMEMQARLTAHRWLTGDLAPIKDFEQPEVLLKMRDAFKSRAADAPQFWFGDYVGYLKDIASHLELRSNDSGFMDREGCISPARFLSDQSNVREARAVMKDLHQTFKQCSEGRYVPRAVFRALQGHWTIERDIESAIPTFPSGMLRGTASFHPRLPTSDKSGMIFDLEYLYIEAGDFTTSTGHTLTASRRYVYRYCEADDQLSVWFVSPDNHFEVDYLFHNLNFVKPEQARLEGASIAKASHLCVEDNYETQYRVPMKGVSLRDFRITHAVKGPNKDYVSSTSYRRSAN